MSDDLYLGAYWGPRQESAYECAERLAACLTELHAIGGPLASWYAKDGGDTSGTFQKKRLERPVHTWNTDEVAHLLLRGRNRRDTDGAVIETLGFSAHLWNWKGPDRSYSPGLSATLSTTCGMYSRNPHLRNVVVLDFPKQLSATRDRESSSRAILAVVKAWQPEWAGLISRRSREARSFTPGAPFVDWMTYLNHFKIDASKLPSSASVMRVDEQGVLIVTQDAPVDASDHIHAQNVRAVEAAIGIC